jgi:hypothetical protein
VTDVGIFLAEDQSKQGGLAGAVWPDQRDLLAWPELEIDGVKNLTPAKGF